MKLCINCYTENPDDVVFCSKCGMSLMGAPTGEQAMNLAEEREQRRAKRRERARRGPEQPLTASGIVYVFGDQFAKPAGSEPARLARNVIRVALAIASQDPFLPELRPVRVPYSGRQVRAMDLGRKLLEAAFVSLAQEGYISLWLDKTVGLLLSREAVSIGQERSQDDLPPSLERSIMNALAPAPQRHWLRSLVPWLGAQKDLRVPGVDIVAEALTEMGWLEGGVPTERSAPLLAAMAGEAETVKARLESFASQNPRLHATLIEELMQPG